MKIDKKLPNLKYLLRCYFHNDWYGEFNNDSTAVIRSFIEDDNHLISSTYNELVWLFDQNFDEPSLQNFISQNLSNELTFQGKSDEFLIDIQNQLSLHLFNKPISKVKGAPYL